MTKNDLPSILDYLLTLVLSITSKKVTSLLTYAHKFGLELSKNLYFMDYLFSFPSSIYSYVNNRNYSMENRHFETDSFYEDVYLQ